MMAIGDRESRAPVVHMAFVGGDGTIIRVNAEWHAFARLNKGRMPSFGVGTSYLEYCTDAKHRADVETLLRGRTELVSFVYPCDTPRKRHWFVAIGLPCRDEGGVRAVVMHVEVTPWVPLGTSMTLDAMTPALDLTNLLLGLQQSMKAAVAEGITAASRSNLAADGERALTPRQQEVLDLIAAGKSNQEIAEALSCSLNTVKRHVSAVLLRLNLSSRTKAALYARQHLGPQASHGAPHSNRTAAKRRRTR
jgi:DNA-binding CsgD family transcriptional regulator